MPNMTDLVQVSDNCPSSGEITVVQNIPEGTSLGSESTVQVYASQHGSRGPSCFVDLNLADNPPLIAVCQPVTIDLDGSGKATLTATNADGGSSSACGALDLSVSQSEFDCTEVGNHLETLTVTNENGGQASCDFMVTIRDLESPSFSNCPGNINVFNDQDDCGALVSWTPPILNDNCIGAIGSSTYNSGDFFPVGSTTVTYSGSDASNNPATDCSFTVNVTDMENPRINCPADINTTTDPGLCGADVSFIAPIADDNCAIEVVNARYREVDQSNSPIGSWTSRVLDPSGFFPLGRYQVQWRAMDVHGNKSSCSHYLEVSDGEAPVAVCQDVTVDFNGEIDQDLSVAQIWDEANSSDNCGSLTYVSTEPSLTIDCEDLGTTIPLTVTIKDEAGNEDACTAYVDVTGLPCGWSEGPQDGSLNCGNDTQVDYDTDDQSFTLSADGCWHDCRDADQAVQAYYVLCGDGQIEARLADINYGGYAGLMARESLDPLARRAGALKNYSTRKIRREWRASYGGNVSQSHVTRSRVEWFRLVRAGKKIKSYTSTNGSYWRLLQVVTLPDLEDCLYMSLMAYSLNGKAEVEAVFDNVSVSSSGNLASSLIVDEAQLPDQQQSYTGLDQFASITLFPNPANEQTQIALEGFEDKPALMIVRDQFGKVVRQLQLDTAAGSPQRLDTNDLTAGLYLISIVQEGKVRGSKKLIVQR